MAHKNRRPAVLLLLALVTLAAGCARTGSGPADSRPGVDAGSSRPQQQETVNAAEPDTYIATLTLMAEAPDGRRLALPELSVMVARDGDSRSVSVILPGSEQVVYLNRAGARYIILPAERQYAELPPGVWGLDLPRLLRPEEVIDYLGHSRGFARAGDAVVGGRSAVKYLATTGGTGAGTGADDLSKMTQVYIDKQTGLPLRTELFTHGSGDTPAGGVKAVTEMRDIRTTAERALFEVPEGYEKVNFEQARRRMEEVTAAATRIADSMLGRSVTRRPGG